MRQGTGWSYKQGNFMQSSFCPICLERTLERELPDPKSHRAKGQNKIKPRLFCSDDCNEIYRQRLVKRIVALDGLLFSELSTRTLPLVGPSTINVALAKELADNDI